MKKTKEPVVLLTVDYAFQYVMRSEEILKSLLAAILRMEPEDIESIRYLSRDLEKAGKEEKLGILDLHLVMKDQYEVNIELQMRNVDYWENRSSFYIFKMFNEQMKSGGKYKVNPCISINILGFNFRPARRKYYSKYMIMETETGDLYTDKIMFHVLELPKLKNAKEEEKNTDLYLWARLFQAASWEEYEELAEKNEGIRKAVDRMREITEDEIKQRQYLHHFLAERDREAERETAMREGKAEGRALGIAEGKAEGRALGIAEGKAEAILILLEEYGEVSEKLKQHIYSEKNPQVLKKWLKLSSSVNNIEEFEKALQKENKDSVDN